MGFYFVYVIYLFLGLLLTIIVGNHLHKNGQPWICNLFTDKKLALRLNDILLLAYRLLNFGYILFTLMNGTVPQNLQITFEFLCNKLGLIIMALAFLHYQNIILLIIFSNLKYKKQWEI
jgi:hypothetical protein